LFLFFVGLIMLASMLGLLFFAGAIYDAEEKQTIETFFFEPNAASSARVDAPISADDMPDTFLRDKLIARFMNEYFYVIPDVNNAEERAECMNTDGTVNALCGMSKKVSKDWRENIAPEIKEMAANGVMRRVEVLGITEAESGHLVVNYRLQTWTQPNNVLAMPEVTIGNLYMDVTRDPIQVRQTKDVLDKLRAGIDPAYAFNFSVIDVPQQ
jgi:hypothetical protein